MEQLLYLNKEFRLLILVLAYLLDQGKWGCSSEYIGRCIHLLGTPGIPIVKSAWCSSDGISSTWLTGVVLLFMLVKKSIGDIPCSQVSLWWSRLTGVVLLIKLIKGVSVLSAVVSPFEILQDFNFCNDYWNFQTVNTFYCFLQVFSN